MFGDICMRCDDDDDEGPFTDAAALDGGRMAAAPADQPLSDAPGPLQPPPPSSREPPASQIPHHPPPSQPSSSGEMPAGEMSTLACIATSFVSLARALEAPGA